MKTGLELRSVQIWCAKPSQIKKKPPGFFVHVNEWQLYAAKDLCTFTEVCVITYSNGRDILSERHHEENKNRGGFAVSYLNKP